MCRKWICLACPLVLLTLLQPNVIHAANGNLVGWWKLDETSGLIAHDSSGYDNHGTLHGDPQWTGRGLEFDGDGDYVDCGDSPSLNSAGSVTVMGWIRLDGPADDRKIAGNQDGITGGYKLGVYGNRLEFEIRTADNGAVLNRSVAGGVVLETGMYHHVAGVYSEGQYIRTYVNGVLDRELATAELLGTSTGTFKLGREPFSDAYYWLGLMHDVRVYNRALTQEEILALVEVESGLLASNPNPADGAVLSPIIPIEDLGDEIATSATLSWTPATGAVSYDVYFSDDFEAVAAGATTALLGSQTTTAVSVGLPGSSFPTGLVAGTTYYWRVNPTGTNGVTYTGRIWNFLVPPLEGWIPFIPGAEPGAVHEVMLKASDNTGITVDSDIPGMYVADVPLDGEVYQRLSMLHGGQMLAVGRPEVPIIRKYFEVPYDVNVTVEVIYSDSEMLEGYNVFPAQAPLADVNLDDTPEFVVDASVYSSDILYPADVAFVEEAFVVRGHRIVALTLCPVQCSPEPRLLKVHSKIEARIVYDRPAQIEGIEERLETEPFEALCEAIILNYRSPSEYPTRRDRAIGSPNADYLIITHDDFKTQADTLAAWKEKKGLATTVVKTSDISSPTPPTAADITKYIQTAYDTWNRPPTYVLLVGDSEFIPTHYQTAHPSSHHGGFETATDLYYATVDGTDYFPDILLGRISVDTAAQAATVVNKILDYEKTPPTDAAFYNNTSVCAYFQDNDRWATGYGWITRRDGFEDRRFVLTSEEIRDFLIAPAQGYNVERIYCTEAAVTPTNYSPATGDYSSYDLGVPLPTDLLRVNGFAWNGGSAEITAAFNAGRLIINHRDHGDSRNFWSHVASGWGAINGWGDPQFTTADVAALTNGNRLPVVFSMNCLTGWFDNEIDQLNDPALTRNDESFCEELLRKQNGGAVAAIGATRISYSGHNDDLCKGFYDAIWPDFDPLVTTGPMYELGQVHTYGKVYMHLHTWFGLEETAFEEFHLFGDPEMRIWTELPTALTVTHPTSIGSGAIQQFVVAVKDASNNAVHHAAVCLLKADDNLQEVSYTDPTGNAVFSVTPATAGTMAVTATKPNHLPYEGAIAVTGQGAAITVSPDVGPPGISITVTGSGFQGAEAVNISMGGTVAGSATASGGSFSTPLTVPSLPVGPTNIVAVGQSSSRAAAAVFTVLPAQPLPDPHIYSQWDSTTWYLAGGTLTWDNPCVIFKDPSGTAVPSRDLEVGTTYTIEATIHSSSSVAASGTTATFTWALWGVGQKIWNLIGTDTVNVPAATVAPSSAVASVLWTPHVTGHCCLRVDIYHPWDSNLKNNMGQENTDVHPITSPAEILIDIHNPTDTTGLVYLDVTQGSAGERFELWETRIERPYPQVLEPNEVQTATLRVDAPELVKIGETRTLSVTGTINGEVIGGVEIQIVKDHRPVLEGWVEPGDEPGSFVYWVSYLDEDHHAPLRGYPTAAIFQDGEPIPGSPFAMGADDPGDDDYGEGKLYRCTVVLPEGDGRYTYTFRARDQLGVGAEGPGTEIMSGP